MIDVINLKKDFNHVQVLKDINVTVNKGDIMVVLDHQVPEKVRF